MLVLLGFQRRRGRETRWCARFKRYQKTSLLEKTPPGAHINKTYAAARGAPSAPGRGCCIFCMSFVCFLCIFSGEAATLKNQRFSTGSTHRKRSGGRLAAFWGRAWCALGALWRRSGARSPLPTARASLPAGPARITIASLPAARLPLRRSRSQAPSRPGQQPGRPQAEPLR